jgi:hypothetical protein
MGYLKIINEEKIIIISSVINIKQANACGYYHLLVFNDSDNNNTIQILMSDQANTKT